MGNFWSQVNECYYQVQTPSLSFYAKTVLSAQPYSTSFANRHLFKELFSWKQSLKRRAFESARAPCESKNKKAAAAVYKQVFRELVYEPTSSFYRFNDQFWASQANDSCTTWANQFFLSVSILLSLSWHFSLHFCSQIFSFAHFLWELILFSLQKKENLMFSFFEFLSSSWTSIQSLFQYFFGHLSFIPSLSFSVCVCVVISLFQCFSSFWLYFYF